MDLCHLYESGVEMYNQYGKLMQSLAIEYDINDESVVDDTLDKGFYFDLLCFADEYID